MKNQIINIDCKEGLKALPDESVNCCVTSPPYFGLRDYNTSTWINGDPECQHIADKSKTKKQGNQAFNLNRPSRQETKMDGFYYKGVCGVCGALRIDNQIGLEETPEQYVQKLVEVFREVKRVLKKEGTLWLNLGDSYANASERGKLSIEKSTLKGGQKTQENSLVKRSTKHGLKPKDLIGIPWMVAFALRADGWYLRQDIIWAKPNPMPESVTDRCTKSHEYIFLLSKSKKYYYDSDAISQPVSDGTVLRYLDQINNIENQNCSDRVPGKTNGKMKAVGPGRKPRPEIDKKGGNQGKENGIPAMANEWANNHSGCFDKDGNLLGDGRVNKRSVWTVTTKPYSEAHFATFPEDLIIDCIKAGCPVDGIVLDPFGGAGTTALVARRLNRNYYLLELNADYVKIARNRLQQELGLLFENV